MSRWTTIDSKHVTRVEGHGNIYVKLNGDGQIEDLKVEIPESPRFFEAMLRGRKHDEASFITSRICGICSIGHTTASLRATEAALGITPSEQTVLLRKLNLDGETNQSHMLHYYFLAAPDALGVGSVFPLVESHPDVVLRALRMKRLANDIGAVVGGRETHPTSEVVNGFTSLPSEADLKSLRVRLEESYEDLDATVDLFAALDFPDFARETEYVSLTNADEYAFYDGDLKSSTQGVMPEADYKKMIHETVVDHSMAKHTVGDRESIMVGALARFNNNYDQLYDRAKKAADKMGLKAPCYNTFFNNHAQVVETVHCTENAIKLIDMLLERGLEVEERSYDVRAGHGVAGVEVPRGLLIHDYTYEPAGTITAANCVIPTNQNFNNMERDMRTIVPSLVDEPEEKAQLVLEMMMRAYDPCISCSVHVVRV